MPEHERLEHQNSMNRSAYMYVFKRENEKINEERLLNNKAHTKGS